jgi:hypothetical protein
MKPMVACVLAILASLLLLAAIARGASPRSRLRVLLTAVPGVALIPVGWAQVAIWMGATLILGWVVAEVASRAPSGDKET